MITVTQTKKGVRITGLKAEGKKARKMLARLEKQEKMSGAAKLTPEQKKIVDELKKMAKW